MQASVHKLHDRQDGYRVTITDITPGVDVLSVIFKRQEVDSPSVAFTWRPENGRIEETIDSTTYDRYSRHFQDVVVGDYLTVTIADGNTPPQILQIQVS